MVLGAGLRAGAVARSQGVDEEWVVDPNRGVEVLCDGGPLDGVTVLVDASLGHPRREYVLALLNGKPVTSSSPAALNEVARRRASGHDGWSVYTLDPESEQPPFRVVFRGPFNYTPALTEE